MMNATTKRVKIISCGGEQEEPSVVEYKKEADWKEIDEAMAATAQTFEASGFSYLISYEGFTEQGRLRQIHLSWSPKASWQK
jgi:hypothetical protein